ncbi:MAG TPA: cell wall hydrolase [Sphingomonas sp.]|nr:cell wall hydrolase [Sphingomonas sp.]
MRGRIALGLATLVGATSCVGSAVEHVERARGVAAPARTAAARAAPMAIPAGPSPALLAHGAAATAVEAIAPASAPPFLGAPAGSNAAARALDCLTAAVYYEARSEPLEGQEAVAQVVLNRVRNPAFPDSVCGTVYEGSSRETGCQFTFTCDGSMTARREPAAWERARRVAAAALDGFVYAPVGSATYYHSVAVHPWWASKVTPVAAIGAHVFYRLPGIWGGSLAFRQRYGGVEPASAAAQRLPEKANDGFIEAIEAGVTVHRGDDAAQSPREEAQDRPAVLHRFGVTIHRGGDAGTIAAEAGRVLVHRGEDA